MADRNQKLGAHNRGCHGGIHVAIDKYKVGLAIGNHRLKAGDDFGGLAGVAAGTDAQVQVRSGHIQLLEENVRHVRVIVLPGVDQSLARSVVPGQCRQYGSYFHEVGTSAYNVQNVHGNGRFTEGLDCTWCLRHQSERELSQLVQP